MERKKEIGVWNDCMINAHSTDGFTGWSESCLKMNNKEINLKMIGRLSK